MGIVEKSRNIVKKSYRKIKKGARLIKGGAIAKKAYIKYIDTLPVNSKCVLLESQHGTSFDGNIYAMLRYMHESGKFTEFETYLTTTKATRAVFKKRLERMGMEEVKLVNVNSDLYFKILATAGYLINDNTFTPNFIKREKQIYLNTWHGTPLKTLGRRIKSEFFAIGNAQKNFLDSDFLLYPNEFTMEHMLEDYMINDIGRGKVWITGYPRNAVFFDTEFAEKIRAEYGFNGKTVYAYMPTWRGIVGKVTSEEQNARMSEYLRALDEKMSEDEIMYVKLHPMSKKDIDLSGMRHISEWPEKYETYEFLNACDCLITDYSSVFFDFAITNKRIILFAYDEEEYEKDRGFYIRLDEMPFEKTNTVDGLYEAMKRRGNNVDNRAFLDKFCAYDSIDTAKEVCERLFFGEKGKIIETDIPCNGKDNVFIYAGGFAKNGITTSIINLMNRIDISAHNYYILFRTDEMRQHPEVLKELPGETRYLGYFFTRSLGLFDTLKYRNFSMHGKGSYEKLSSAIHEMAKKERRRILSYAKVDRVVHFNGYVNEMILMFGECDCPKTIYAHNDMLEEIRTKHNVSMEILREAYEKYDNVAVVAEDLIPVTEKISGKKANIVVVPNVINYESILEKAELPLKYDEKTEANVPESTLRAALESEEKKFVNVGRFSHEKGQKRLIDAFDRLYEEEKSGYLIIVGGYGAMYEQILAHAASKKSKDRIFIIKYLSNPFPLIKRCDYFVLSSFYEGFGLVLAEADILGLGCISTDITGPKFFMEKYGGKLVENTEDGIYEGMKDCMLGNVPKKLTVDYAEYNKEAVRRFEQLIK